MNYSGLAGVINAHFHPYCDIYFTYMQQKAKTRIKSEVPLEILQKGKNVIATYEKACKYGTSTMDVVRVIIFGVENVGKTSLLKSLIGEETKTDQLPTIDIDTSRSVDSSDWDADGNIKEGCRYDVERDVSTGSGYNTDSDEEVVMAAGKRNGVIENGDTMHSGNQIQNHSDEDKNNKNISHKSDKSQTQPGVKNDANSGHLFIEAGISGGKGLLKTVLRKGMAEKLRATLQQASDKQKSNAKQSDEQRSRSRSLQTKSKSKKHRSISAHEMPSEPRERKYSLQGNIRSNSRGNNDRCKTPPLTKEESGMQLKFWDFSDSFEYYTTKLSSRSSIYILVFNAAKHIEEMIEKRDGSHDIYTYLDKMTTWLQSIHLHTLREEDCILGNDLSFSPPAIILVGTHGDEIQIENEEERTNKINQMYAEIMGALEDEPYHKHIVCSNVVIDTHDKSDKGLNKLRRLIKDIVRSLPACKDKIPKKWFDILENLRDLKRKNQARSIKAQELFVTDDNNEHNSNVVENADIILDYFHDVGELLRFPRDHPLADTILGDVEWLLKSIAKLLNRNALSYTTHSRRLTEEWEKFKVTGIISDRYIDKIWPNYNLDTRKDIALAVMQHLDLICQQSSQAESKESGKETNAKGRHKDKAKYYYAPCTMSNISLPTDEELYPQDCIQSVWLKIKFKDEIPDITFYRLLTCCLRKWNTNPKLYRNCVIYSIATQVSLIIKKEGIHVGLQILFRPVNKNESKREIDDKMITNGIGIAARVHVEKQLVKLLKKWNASMKKQYSLYFLCPCICQTNQDHLDDEMKQKVCNNFINLGNVINTLEASKDQKIQYKDIHCDNCNQTFSSMNYLKFWFKLPDENLQ